MTPAPRYIALSGGVGGAKLSRGLATELGENLSIIVNTGDDFTHLGLRICPDVDSVTYALAGMNDVMRGWGVADETWSFMEQMRRLGGADWFLLGDRDLALHVLRSQALGLGQPLSDFTAKLTARLGIRAQVLPMSDQPVATVVGTTEGPMAFQDWFVRRKCEPEVIALDFQGAAAADAAPSVTRALKDPHLAGIILCPSNPFVSIAPILATGGIGARLRAASCPRIAVSPLIAGNAVKGPAADMARSLGMEPSALGIARHYAGLIDGLVIDRQDEGLARQIEALGLRVEVAQTLMDTEADKVELARRCIGFCAALAESRD